MGKTIYKYRVLCVTENAFNTTWSDTTPTKCPCDEAHVIDEDSIVVIDQVSQNAIQVQNDTTNTKGHYMLDGLTFPISDTQPNTLYIKTVPMPISCYSVYCYPSQSNLGDSVNCYFSFPPTNPIAATPVGSSNILLSPAFAALVDNGFNIYLAPITNPAQQESLGRIIDVNEATGTITTEFGASNAYTTNDLLFTRVYFVKDLYFPVQDKYVIGQGTLNGTYVPKNTPIYIDYKNNNQQSKTMTFHIEYMY